MNDWEKLIAEESEETITEYSKSQNIRLIDVFFIAPVCVYAGIKGKELPKWIRISLVGIGLATFYYNGKNYLINKQKENQNGK
jgi:hypothetical protein